MALYLTDTGTGKGSLWGWIDDLGELEVVASVLETEIEEASRLTGRGEPGVFVSGARERGWISTFIRVGSYVSISEEIGKFHTAGVATSDGRATTVLLRGQN